MSPSQTPLNGQVNVDSRLSFPESDGKAISISTPEIPPHKNRELARAHPNSSSPAISDLIARIYEACDDSSRWQALLDAYLQAVEGRRGYLFLNSGTRDGFPSVRRSSWPDGDARLYTDQYMAGDLHKTAGMASPEGAVQAIDLACRAGALEQSSASGKFNELQDVRYQMSGVFLRSADTSSTIVAVRGEREGPFLESAFAILKPLIPHLRRAAVLQNELFSLRARLAGVTVYLDRCRYRFLLISAKGRIVYANAAAYEAATLNDGLAISAGGLSFLSPQCQAAFVDALERVVAQRVPALCRLEVKRPSHKSPYLLLMMPVSISDGAPLGPAQCAVSVLIVDREERLEPDPAILGETFSLTPAEARVTAKLGCGWSAEQIAEQLGISLQTVRTHIRRILSKTATARQGELISLVLRTATPGNV